LSTGEGCDDPSTPRRGGSRGARGDGRASGGCVRASRGLHGVRARGGADRRALHRLGRRQRWLRDRGLGEGIRARRGRAGEHVGRGRPPAGLLQAGRARGAAQPRDERRDRGAQGLRVHRQPHGRRPRGPAAGRADGGRRRAAEQPAAGGRAARSARRRVHARAARVAREGPADRAQHQLRRRPRPAPLHGAVDQQHPLLRHQGPQRRTASAAARVQGRYARVLPLGGPEGRRAGP
jgi:hypothetical protein